MNMPTITQESITGDMAKSLIAYANEVGASTKRLAQGRKELGRCKVVITFDKFPGWADNAVECHKFVKNQLGKWKKEVGRNY